MSLRPPPRRGGRGRGRPPPGRRGKPFVRRGPPLPIQEGSEGLCFFVPFTLILFHPMSFKTYIFRFAVFFFFVFVCFRF